MKKKSRPQKEKIRAAIQYFEQHGSFAVPILFEQKEQGWILKDGYAQYLAARKLHLEEMEVALYEGDDDRHEINEFQDYN
ncbi:hypothetical protein [Paenibacillus mendelii]|uniref:Uncharacterized protein n=1 Tax=Paenibacillus mendelii TaxID=206163 RepID=A0ABV6JE19_9BACL|nr:hypothetical protein [Paenibacillus mendelii]